VACRRDDIDAAEHGAQCLPCRRLLLENLRLQCQLVASDRSTVTERNCLQPQLERELATLDLAPLYGEPGDEVVGPGAGDLAAVDEEFEHQGKRSGGRVDARLPLARRA